MIGFIGGGNMAEALIRGMTAKGMKDIIVSEPREGRGEELHRNYGILATKSNVDVVGSCDIIFLAIKPQIMEDVLGEISDYVSDRKVIVSIAAGITLSYLQSKLKTKLIIRVMPNTPAIVQEGMSVISLCESSYGQELETVKNILMSVGKVIVLPEEQMNAVTALSGSGPAFVALFTEAMIEAGILMGIDRDDSIILAHQTVLGTARLLESGMSAENLRKMVTSPGGTTAAGLKTFEERVFRDIVVEALESARKRAVELGRRE